MKIFLVGYPGDLGGANTEAWHVIKLWRQFGIEVHLVPTWHADETWKRRLDAIGCITHVSSPDKVESVPGLPGAITVGFCNSEYLRVAWKLRKLSCKIVWANCMTFLFDHEKNFFRDRKSVV